MAPFSPSRADAPADYAASDAGSFASPKSLAARCCRLSRGSPRVPILDRYELDALSRWRAHGVLPRSAALQVSVFIIICVFVSKVTNVDSVFAASVHNAWVSWLFPAAAGTAWAANSLTWPGDEFFV
jgi:hypothetical protein